MGFFLFILVNATLFIRPGEIVPDLEQWPIYLWLILACLVVSARPVLEQLRWASLRADPVTFCVVGLWLMVVLSHLVHLSVSDAKESGNIFGKVVIYYLLLVAVVDSPARLRQFQLWLVVFVVVAVGLAVLQYHGFVNLPGLSTLEERRFDEESGEYVVVPRLRSTGIFNDPNDLCLILTLGILLCLYQAGDRRRGPLRWGWLAPVGLFGYGLVLTQSRGGLLGLLVGLLVLLRSRFGWWKTVLASAAVLPAILLMATGRQLSFDLSNKDDTGQARIQLWAEGFALFQQAPLTGIGAGRYAEEVGLVAHNSFVHAFTELGFIGGTLFASAFILAVWGIGRLSSDRRAAEEARTAEPELLRLQPYMTAIVAGYAAGLLSISRNYVPPTYVVLGLASVYLRQAGALPCLPSLKVDQQLLKRMLAFGAASVGLIYVWIRLFANYG